MSNEVLVCRGWQKTGNGVYHLPSEENPEEPKCDTVTFKKRGFVRKDKSVLPTYDVCKMCSGEYDNTGTRGPQLRAKLNELEPEDLGLGGSA